MRRNARTMLWVLAVTSCAMLATIEFGAVPADGSDKPAQGDKEAVETEAKNIPTLEEARDRARLLHETIHATLQIVHHQYYREGERLLIPARTLEAVFAELDRRTGVKARWLAVNGRAMNVDHNPRDDFEKSAAKALASGKEEFELAEDGLYRHAGAITLSSECLHCHLPQRIGTEKSTAGLVIVMSVERQ